MADLALNDSLIDEYIKYKFQDSYSPDKMRKLFKYILPFAIRNSHSIMKDPAMAIALESDPLIEIIDNCSDEDVVQNSILKLMLIDTHSTANYTKLNINNTYEKLKLKYAATYPSQLDKDKALVHIKALLSDSNWVRITDGYIANSSQWDKNKETITDIVPFKSFDLTIVGGDKDTQQSQINASEKEELKLISSNNWNVKACSITANTHDRYIETDKLKILLSSGLYHLSTTSSKDFTYIVEIK